MVGLNLINCATPWLVGALWGLAKLHFTVGGATVKVALHSCWGRCEGGFRFAAFPVVKFRTLLSSCHYVDIKHLAVKIEANGASGGAV